MKVPELLRTKLLIPPIREILVARPQLIEQLNESLYRKLALVSAPAGYGKTTLLSAWARQVCQERQSPVAWFSLDEEDNDPIRFLYYFCASFEMVDPVISKNLMELVQADRFAKAEGNHSIEAFQVELLNRLQSISDPFVLILDDYHWITAQQTHQFIGFLLDHLPSQMHLVIASRADPPLSLPRLRARGQLIEIRLPQFRFSVKEAGEFFQQYSSLPLSDSEVATLTNRTEGWAAGLQMAALAIQGRADLTKAIQDFTGSNRYIMDYLLEEVLNHQPEAIQEFLLKTSILKRLSAPLCEALLVDMVEGLQSEKLPLRTEHSDHLVCQPILDYLERANLFILPLDDQREWYRYHRLFANLLRKRLQETHSDFVPILHQRASHWLGKHGMVEEAIDHAFEAGKIERAADLLEESAEEMLTRGEVTMLLGWIQHIPADFVRSRSRLDLYWVTSLVLLARDRDAIETGLERLSHYPDLIYEIDVLRAYLAIHAVRLTAAETLARRALDGLPADGAVFFRSVANWLLSATQEFTGNLNRRIEVLEEMIRKARVMGNRLEWASVLCALADVRFNQADLLQARDLYQEAIRVGTNPDGRLLPIAGEALIGLGHVLFEWNELEQAAQDLQQGIELSRQVRESSVIEGFLGLSLCRQAQGDAAGARWAIGQAHRAAVAIEAANVYVRLVDFYEALILNKQGEDQAISRYFEKWRSRENPPTESKAKEADFETQLRKFELIAWARSCLANQKRNEALLTLEELLPDVTRRGYRLLVAEIELLRALALNMQGNRKDAQVAFESALAAAEPGGLVRLFIDEGSAIVLMLQEALQHKIHVQYASRLLKVFDKLETIHSPDSAQDKLAFFIPYSLEEPLTSRELEVLILLVNRLSAKEIADQLSLAESTVNSHINSIYGKLGVHRRMDAIQKAKTLGLI